MADLYTLEIAAVQSILGVVGAGVREAMLYDPTKPPSKVRTIASLATGGTLAPTTAGILANYLIKDWGLDMVEAVALAMAVSFWIGVIGIGLVSKVLDGSISLSTFLPGQKGGPK